MTAEDAEEIAEEISRFSTLPGFPLRLSSYLARHFAHECEEISF